MIRRILKAVSFGIAATLAVQTLAPITRSPDYALLQVCLSSAVGLFVAMGVMFSD